MGKSERQSSRKGSRSSSRPPSGYPKPWSLWQWNDEYQSWYRGQEVSKGKFEYEYSKTPPLESSSSDDPRTIPEPVSGLPQVLENDLQDPNVNYTTDTPVSDITSGLAAARLEDEQEPIPPPQIQANIRSRKPKLMKEEFDPHYKVHRQNAFKWGRLLKVLWSEPHGEGGATGGTEISVREDKGKTVFAKVRRFLIIKENQGHCLCLPIMTYGGQGTTKHGVHASDHAVIYTSETPYYLPEENGMTKEPIMVTPDTPRHKLDPTSRLNYTKLYTIEYNVKVWFIGRVHEVSEWHLTAAYNDTHRPLPSRGLRPPSDQGTGFSNPGTGFASQGTGFSSPGTGFSSHGATFSNPGTGFSSQSATFSNQVTGFPNQGTGFSNPGAGYSHYDMGGTTYPVTQGHDSHPLPSQYNPGTVPAGAPRDGQGQTGSSWQPQYPFSNTNFKPSNFPGDSQPSYPMTSEPSYPISERYPQRGEFLTTQHREHSDAPPGSSDQQADFSTKEHEEQLQQPPDSSDLPLAAEDNLYDRDG